MLYKKLVASTTGEVCARATFERRLVHTKQRNFTYKDMHLVQYIDYPKQSVTPRQTEALKDAEIPFWCDTVSVWKPVTIT